MKKIYLAVVLSFILASVSILAEAVEFVPPVENGAEVQHLGYKFANTSSIIISTIPEISCTWKPDSKDDGWKDCEAIFDVENQNQIRPTIVNAVINFTFRENDWRNQQITFSNTSTLVDEIIFNYTTSIIRVGGEQQLEILEHNYTFRRRNFSDFTTLPAQIDTSQPFAIKITYEEPKYAANNFNLSLSAAGFSAFIDPSQNFCGTLASPGKYTLTKNLDSDGTCLTITSPDVTVECNGYNITYAKPFGSGSGSGIYSSGPTEMYANLTIQNCVVDEGGSGGDYNHGLNFYNVLNLTVLNTSIITHSSNSYGLRVSSSNNSLVENNTITTQGFAAHGTYLYASTGSEVRNNTLDAQGSWNFAAYFYASDGNNLSRNMITASGSNGQGVELSSSADANKVTNNNVSLSSDTAAGIGVRGSYNNITLNDITTTEARGISLPQAVNNTISSNEISTSGSSAFGISLSANTTGNIILNNNITANNAKEIDDTDSSKINYLVYNNSLGEIRWTNDSFLYELNVSVDNSEGIGLGRNLFIGDNIVALNITAFGINPLINTTANLTLHGLTSLPSVTEIKRLESYSTNSSEVIKTGSGCTGSTCEILDFTLGSVVFNTTSFSSFAVESYCGYINEDTTLTGNASSTDECFTINASDLTLDCAGYSITYGVDGNNNSYAVNNIGFDNVTVRNCLFEEGNADGIAKHAIYFETLANNGLIENNTFNLYGAWSFGIYIYASDYNTLAGNMVTSNGSNGQGIELSLNSDWSTVVNNTFTISSSPGVGIGSHGPYGVISYNNITTSEAVGISLSQAVNNTVSYNEISTSGSNAAGISLATDTAENTLLNNNVTAADADEIYDTDSSTNNYLVYNNSFGEIRWTDAGFLQNLTTAVDNDQGLGMSRNLFIGDNAAALNTSSFGSNPLINSSANITLFGVTSLTNASEVSRLEAYSTDSAEILSDGTNCDGISCEILNTINGDVTFNTTSFSSFAIPGEVDVYNLTLLFTNSSAYSTIRFFMRNLLTASNILNWTLDTGESIINSTIESNLTFDEIIFVFVEHNYASPGSYTVVANGTTANDFDSEEKQVTVG